jgi:hypothetical protein
MYIGGKIVIGIQILINYWGIIILVRFYRNTRLSAVNMSTFISLSNSRAIRSRGRATDYYFHKIFGVFLLRKWDKNEICIWGLWNWTSPRSSGQHVVPFKISAVKIMLLRLRPVSKHSKRRVSWIVFQWCNQGLSYLWFVRNSVHA